MLYRCGITTLLKGRNVMKDSGKKKMMCIHNWKRGGISISKLKIS